ncbi:LysR family transcriptional regulator [Frankia sp. AgB1.9]|nr:LysR family transcriptional regulator [Frankia sp. AgW1.1]MBL7553180.1 LysR family transcriptional regulator [Frankia sp. AgB1.9]MBL7621675.1 LysR family transcriptional regulator [Frankia sp. AgB1.8]
MEHFLAVAEEGGFTRAATRLHMVQSGVSASIRSLERELGVDLFERTTQHVELTEAGRALIPEARRVLGAVRQARQVVTEVRDGARGTLSVGIPDGLTPRAVLAALAAFRADHPLVQVRLTAPGQGGCRSGPPAQVARLREGELDLAVLAATGPVPGLRLYTLRTETLVLACAADHPLAGRDALTLPETGELGLIEFPTGWGVRAAVDRAYAAAGLTRRPPELELTDLATVVDLVRHRLGVAFVPGSLADQATDLRFVPIDPHPPRYQLAIGIPLDRPLSTTAATFLERCLRPSRAA